MLEDGQPWTGRAHSAAVARESLRAQRDASARSRFRFAGLFRKSNAVAPGPSTSVLSTPAPSPQHVLQAHTSNITQQAPLSKRAAHDTHKRTHKNAAHIRTHTHTRRTHTHTQIQRDRSTGARAQSRPCVPREQCTTHRCTYDTVRISVHTPRQTNHTYIHTHTNTHTHTHSVSPR